MVDTGEVEQERDRDARPVLARSTADDHATIVEDYALSAGYFARPAVGTIEQDDWRHPELIVESTPVYMRVALDHLATEHGGARALLRRQGFTDAELDRLVTLLTEAA